MPRNTDTTAATQKQKELKKLRVDLYFKNPKLCELCNKPIGYIEHKRKRFCSKACATSVNNRKRKVNKAHSSLQCLNCNGVIIKKNAYKFCSQKCFFYYNSFKRIEKWLLGEEISTSEQIPSNYKKYLLEKSNNSCSKCGWNEINLKTQKCPLTIDHINGDPSDNRYENLRVLCPNCHSLTPTYGALNKGKGRKRRYKI